MPLVCICVGGGPGTFTRLLQQLQQANPVLIVRNSGGIADGTVNFIDAYKDKVRAGATARTLSLPHAKLTASVPAPSAQVEEGFELTQHVSDDELKELCAVPRAPPALCRPSPRVPSPLLRRPSAESMSCSQTGRSPKTRQTVSCPMRVEATAPWRLASWRMR